MSGERRAIEHPLWIDFSGQPVPPLKFVLQTTYSPVGIVERPAPALTISHAPWYTELAVELRGVDAVAVLYLIDKDDQTVLLTACIDSAFEPFFGLLSGADFGDEVTKLTAQHWPEMYGMLVRGNALVANGMVLANVATPHRAQWVVANHLRASEVDNVGDKQMLELIGTSVQTFVRATNPGRDLPGLIQVLGGPDRTTRRLNALTGLLGAGSDIGEVLQGGMNADELVGLGQAALNAVSSMLALKD